MGTDGHGSVVPTSAVSWHTVDVGQGRGPSRAGGATRPLRSVCVPCFRLVSWVAGAHAESSAANSPGQTDGSLSASAPLASPRQQSKRFIEVGAFHRRRPSLLAPG